MNNLFKQNSRFAALIEVEQESLRKEKKQQHDTKFNSTEEHVNRFKNDKNLEDNFNSFRQRDYDNNFLNYNKVKKDKNKKESNLNLKDKLLNLDEFPSLVNLTEKKNKEQTLNYIEKIQQPNINSSGKKKDSLDPDLVDLKPGWVVLKRDKKTGNTIIKSHPFNENQYHEKSDLQISEDTLKALVCLHEKRSKEYIDTYGYDTWEKMFKSPRWIEEELEYMSDSDDYDDDEEEYIDNDNEYEFEY
jgi:hypothetical protein